MADVRLDPMTDEEYAAYAQVAIAGYADAHVAARSWPAEEARQRAEAEYAELLPDGPATPGQHLYVARDADRRVGMPWFGERPHGTVRTAYIYDIQVDADLRGKGYGTALLLALEHKVRALGLNTVRPHVFGDNATARSLYHELGYAETNVVMAKHLDPPADG